EITAGFFVDCVVTDPEWISERSIFEQIAIVLLSCQRTEMAGSPMHDARKNQRCARVAFSHGHAHAGGRREVSHLNEREASLNGFCRFDQWMQSIGEIECGTHFVKS